MKEYTKKIINFFELIIIVGVPSILLFMGVILLNSCFDKDPIDESKLKRYDVNYNIISIKIDDDSEYHIVAVSQNGDVKSIHDADAPRDINIRYGNYSKPILRMYFIDCNPPQENRWVRRNKPYVFLPYGFKIQIFND